MKKYILKSILFTTLLFFNLMGINYETNEIIEFTEREVFIPEKLGRLNLYKDSNGFHIFKDGKIYDVQNCFCTPLLRKMSNDQLMKFVGRDQPTITIIPTEELSQIDSNNFFEISEDAKNKLISQLFRGYISVNQMDNGEYILHDKIRFLKAGTNDDNNETIIKMSIMISITAPQLAIGAVAVVAIIGSYKLLDRWLS